LYYTKPGSYERLRHTAELLNFKGKPRQAAAHYTELLRKKELSYHQRAMIAHDLSQLMKGQERIRLITLAAIYDIRSSTKETLAIFTLGNILFEQGEIEEAELLLQEALHQAQFYGNILHKMEIQAIITTVSAQKLIISESKKNTALTIMIIFLAIAIIGTAIVSFIVFTRLKNVRLREIIVQKKNQHLDKINKKLLEDASIKEEYIGYFFNIISGYILKLEKIKRNTERKIKIKNYDELLQVANEIDIKHERNTLFYTFDSIFLKLFPNFIETFNSLLKPEDQIWPKGHEVLNTNLRIFALMRLGIKDNQTIANILESTVSTIYTYKIRVKSKAFVQGDDFENRIMEIKFVDLDN
jgi:tetratricopeptide (TPR) repeat protein